MYYILSKKYQKDGAPCFDQIGIVIADTIEEAAKKVGLPIVYSFVLPNSSIASASWVELERNYHLDALPEWDGNLPDDATYDGPYRPGQDIKVPVPTMQDLFDGGILE